MILVTNGEGVSEPASPPTTSLDRLSEVEARKKARSPAIRSAFETSPLRLDRRQQGGLPRHSGSGDLDWLGRVAGQQALRYLGGPVGVRREVAVEHPDQVVARPRPRPWDGRRIAQDQLGDGGDVFVLPVD